MELTKRRGIWLAGGALGILGFGLYLFLYHPLLAKLQIQGKECRALEEEVSQGRQRVTASQGLEKTKALITEQEVSRAIDELTRTGKLKNINFISMTPQPIHPREGFPYKVLPIEIEAESSYENLGRFLGSLRELKGSLTKVGSLKVYPDAENPSRLETTFVLNLYLID